MHDLKCKKVLVAGATGLIGRALVVALLDHGADVTGSAWDERPVDWPDGCGYVRRDFNRPEDCAWSLAAVEYLFCLLGGKGGVGIGRTAGADFLRVNIDPVLSVANRLRGSPIQRTLYVSSVGAYPGHKTIFVESEINDGPPHHSDYFAGCAKRFGEIVFAAYREQYGIDYVVARPTNVFGPHDRFHPKTGMAIAAMIARIEAGENPLVVWGDGSAARDFLYSGDCAAGLIRIMERGQSGEAYNLGTGVPVQIKTIAEELRGLYPNLTVQYDTSKPAGPPIRAMDTTKISSLGWQAKTSLKIALHDTVEWYRVNRHARPIDPYGGQNERIL